MVPNIVKGRGISGAIAYAMSEGNDPTGKRKELEEGAERRAEIIGGQNFGFAIDSEERLELARRMMEWSGLPENQASRTRKCENDCLHISLSWNVGQHPDHAEMDRAARGVLKALGMERAQAVFIAHHDTDQAHIHIIASRIDPVTGLTFSDKRDWQQAQAWGLRWERENNQTSEARRELHNIVDAIEVRDTGKLLDLLTMRESTFTAKGLGRILSYGIENDAERDKYRLDILADKQVVGLRENAEAAVTHYTTRDVLAAERSVSRAALQLEQRGDFGLDEIHINLIADRLTLHPEQRAGFEHLTDARGFAMLAGEAGTGKSHTLRAVREAYEADGFRVIGAAWTHKVVGNLRNDGFSEATTLAAEMKRLEGGSSHWNDKTVVVVDEAAMLSTKAQAELMGHAAATGAKVILAGDDRQLGSIERGGMFSVLRDAHGAAELHEVQRTKDVEQKRAFNQMHKRDFAKALDILDQKGAIHWTATQVEAAMGLATQYTADVAADPTKDRFIYAYTNADVAALNGYARNLARKDGRLGTDHILPMADGKAAFATGDRIQFTGSAATAKERRTGLVNGGVGTVRAIQQEAGRNYVTVALDAEAGQKPKIVCFAAGDNKEAGEFNAFRHGYAGTIYKGQGRTLDQAYVYHSSHWRAASAYVALSRHRESVTVFAARETAKDLADLARQMGRDDRKRAASAFVVDDAQEAAKGQLIPNRQMVAQHGRQSPEAGFVLDPATAAWAQRQIDLAMGKAKTETTQQRPVWTYDKTSGRMIRNEVAAQASSGIAAAGKVAAGAIRASGAVSILGSILMFLAGGPDPAPARRGRLDPTRLSEEEREQRRAALAQKYGPDVRSEDAIAEEDAARQRRDSGQSQR